MGSRVEFSSRLMRFMVERFDVERFRGFQERESVERGKVFERMSG